MRRVNPMITVVGDDKELRTGVRCKCGGEFVRVYVDTLVNRNELLRCDKCGKFLKIIKKVKVKK